MMGNIGSGSAGSLCFVFGKFPYLRSRGPTIFLRYGDLTLGVVPDGFLCLIKVWAFNIIIV